mgnify:CR=1 FL=1
MAEYKLVVMTSAVEGREDEFNDWYDNEHLGDICALPGFTDASRYELESFGENSMGHKYLAIYDMETDDVDATMQNMIGEATSGRMHISEAMAMPTVTLLYKKRGD